MLKWQFYILTKSSFFSIWRKLVLTKIKQFTVITSLFIVWSCSFLFQNDCFFTMLSEIYSFIMILSVFYFTLFPFLNCHGVLPKRNHTGKSWATWCNYRRRWSRNCMNLEKNMRNIFGHAIFAAAVSIVPSYSLQPKWLGYLYKWVLFRLQFVAKGSQK